MPYSVSRILPRTWRSQPGENSSMTYGSLAIKNPSLRFGVLFTVSCAIVYLLLAWLPTSVFTPLNIYTAKTTAYFLSFLGASATTRGDLVTTRGFSVRIIGECTSLYVSVLYACFILAHAAPLRRKLVGVLLGVPALALANLIRLVIVLWVSSARPSLFEWVHVYLGHIYMALCTLLACIAWLRWVEKAEGEERGGIYFFIRFLGFASILFFVWIECNDAFMKMLDGVIASVFSFFHYRLVMPHGHSVYYQTFNMVTYAALILAARFTTMKRKAGVLAGGLALLTVLHLVFRLCNVFMTAFGVDWAFNVSTSVNFIGQLLLPFALWIVFSGRQDAAHPLEAPDISSGKAASPRRKKRRK